MKTSPSSDGAIHALHTTFHDAVQHDLLASIRIVENLGVDRAVPQDLTFWEDKRFLVILNWIALCFSPEPSHHDVAVSMHSSQGTVVLNLANDDGLPATSRQRELEDTFLSTLRGILRHNMDVEDAQDTLNVMLAEHLFPAFDKKLRAVGLLIGECDPEASYRELHSLINKWMKYTSHTGDNCPMFYNHLDKPQLLGIASLLIFRDHAPHINKSSSTEEKLDYMQTIGKACALLLSSTFYLDMVTPESRPIRKMDPDENKFVIGFIRRVYAVYMYTYGVTRFVKVGLRFIRRSLGTLGLSKFIEGDGGIITRWVELESPRLPSLVWRSSPSMAIQEILALPGLELWDVDEETLQEIPNCEGVRNLWRLGTPVDPSPKIHAELVMVHYLEDQGLKIVKGAVGLSRPPCYLCHLYLRKFVHVSKQAYRIPHTDGRTHGPWRLPCPVETQLYPLASVLKRLRVRVKQAVEEYACECVEF